MVSEIAQVLSLPLKSPNRHDLYPMIFDKAAAYAYHIAEAQAFVDGNKRTALDVALTFLAINGYEVESESMELYEAMIAIAERRMSKDDLAQLFERLTKA